MLRLSDDFGNNFDSGLAAANKTNSLTGPKWHGLDVAPIILPSSNCLVTNYLVVFPSVNDGYTLARAAQGARGRPLPKGQS